MFSLSAYLTHSLKLAGRVLLLLTFSSLLRFKGLKGICDAISLSSLCLLIILKEPTIFIKIGVFQLLIPIW